jgi:hypothetical protein
VTQIRRFGDRPTAPDKIKQFILADDAIPALDQVDEQIKDLRSDRDCLAAA